MLPDGRDLHVHVDHVRERALPEMILDLAI